MESAIRDYVAVTYDEAVLPYTEYPDKLARYLVDRYGLRFDRLLDVGCGRGEFLRGFLQCGLDAHGVDQSVSAAEKIIPSRRLFQAKLDHHYYPLAYPDHCFDTVFSKSVLEHFYYPEKLAAEMYRITKPGGRVIAMVPDWASAYKTFYDDHTHRTPLTATSLKNLLTIAGFNDVKVEKFRQLPFLWVRPWLLPVIWLVAAIAPRFLWPYSKLVKFSQNVMLLASARKGDN